MQANQLISLYSTLYYVSMGLCIFGFVLSVLFFFVFDIRKVYTQITGRGKDKLMKRSAKDHSNSDKAQKNRNSAGIKSGDLYTAGISGGVVPPSEDMTAPLLKASGGRLPLEVTAVLPKAAEPKQDQRTMRRSLKPDSMNGSGGGLHRTKAGRFEIYETVMEIHTDEFI